MASKVPSATWAVGLNVADADVEIRGLDSGRGMLLLPVRVGAVADADAEALSRVVAAGEHGAGDEVVVAAVGAQLAARSSTAASFIR